MGQKVCKCNSPVADRPIHTFTYPECTKVERQSVLSSPGKNFMLGVQSLVVKVVTHLKSVKFELSFCKKVHKNCQNNHE